MESSDPTRPDRTISWSLMRVLPEVSPIKCAVLAADSLTAHFIGETSGGHSAAAAASGRAADRSRHFVEAIDEEVSQQRGA